MHSGTCGHFAIDLERAQACFLVFSRCSCCAAVCGGFFADLAKQWHKIVGGFLRSENSIFPFVFLVLCVFFLLFLFLSLARAIIVGTPVNTQSEYLWYLQAVPVLSLWQGVGVEIVCPLMGSCDSGQWSLRQWFGQNAAHFAVFTQGYLKRKDAKHDSLIYAQRSTIHLNVFRQAKSTTNKTTSTKTTRPESAIKRRTARPDSPTTCNSDTETGVG